MSSKTHLLAGLLTVVGCAQTQQELTIVFPDEAARASTTTITYIAFEPVLSRSESSVFVGCGDVGVFPPTRVIDPDSISSFPNLGDVLQERQPNKYPFEGDWDISFPEARVDATLNPWGAAMVYIEARGEVRAPQDQGGGMLTATLLSGCYCVRTTDGTHSDATLDATVKKNCELLKKDDNNEVIPQGRVVELAPVPRREFSLAPCGVTQLAAPRNELLSPGPAVCISTTRCEDSPVPNCFQCAKEDCEEDGVDFRNVPVLFEVDQPDGSSGPKAQVVLTDSKGQARGAITVDDCTFPITVRASVVGRSDAPVEFAISCVTPIDPTGQKKSFECQGDIPAPTDQEPFSITTLPGGVGRPDMVALLYIDGTGSRVQVLDLARGDKVNLKVDGRAVGDLVIPNEVPRAIHGYYYKLGNGPRAGERPVLAIAGSGMTTNGTPGLILHLYDWDFETKTLTAHDRGTGVIAETCYRWACGGQGLCADPGGRCTNDASCIPGQVCGPNDTCQPQTCTGPGECPNGLVCREGFCGCGANEVCERNVCTLANSAIKMCAPPNQTETCCTSNERLPSWEPASACGCKLKVEFGTEVSLATTDTDRDGLADLGVATSSDLPVVLYFSGSTSSTAAGELDRPLYYPQGCTCGRYAQAPSSFELLDFGGTTLTPPPAISESDRHSIDLVIGAPGGAFVKYANVRPSGQPDLGCAQPARFGDLVPVRDVKRGRFQCNPFGASPNCDPYEDVVVVAAKSLGGGSFDDPGTIRIVYGGPRDLSQEDLFADPSASQELIPRAFPMRADPKDPRTAQIADFNSDENDDLAILFGGGSTPEVHIWLGAANRGVGEVEVGAMVDQCPAIGMDKDLWKCNAHKRFATPDIDGDGRAELAVICDANAMNARVRWFAVR